MLRPLQNAPPEKAKETILYVEDEVENQLVAQERLKRFYDVIIAEDARQACEIIKTQGEALSFILMDIQLKGATLDGIELTRLFRGKEIQGSIPSFAADLPVLDVPILFVTAHGDKFSEEELVQAGGDGLINKPVNFNQLMSRMTECYLARAKRQKVES